MKGYILKIWICIGMACCFTGVKAQVPYFRTYSLLKKKEPVQVNAIFQDRSGFIWHATDKGLFRFDGRGYTRYTLDDSLPDNRVTAIAQDKDGRLWLGFRNGKICTMLDGKVSRFEAPEGSTSMEISDMLFDRHGTLWFSTLNDGLYYYTGNRLFRVDEEDGLSDLYIYDIAEDHAGRIWAGTDGGAAMCRLASGKVTVKMVGYENGLPDHIVKKVKVGDNGSVWLGTEDAGIINYDPINGKCRSLTREKWQYGVVKDFLVHGNEVWIASVQHGLVVYNLQTSRFKVHAAESGRNFGTVNVMMKDNEGSIWAGTREGVVRAPGNGIELIDQFLPSKDANIIAVAQDKAGNLWFSNNEGLFKRSTDAMGKVTVSKQLTGTPYLGNVVINLYADAAGTIWAGFYGEGLIRIGTDGRISNFSSELRNGNVLHITGKGNTIWLATLGGASLITDLGSSFSVKNFGHHNGLGLDYIYQVFIDSKNKVWFATDGKGADMLDEMGFHHYRRGLRSGVVYGFAEDKNGRIWVNAQGDGLMMLDGESFIPFKEEAKLRDHNINSLGSDEHGNLVFMHDAGLDVFDVNTGLMRSFGEETGIQDKKPNLNCISHTATGDLLFGTDAGIVRYSTSADFITTLPRPYISGMKAPGVSMENIPGNLSLNHDQNDVTINFLGFWYQDPENLSFRYMLENNDREWISTKNLSVTYSSLSPGTYTFRLKASASGDFASARETSLIFKISPPFWQTPLFYSLVAVGAVAVVFWVVKYREKSLVEANRRLEAKVTQRTEEIVNKNEEIQTQYEEIQAQNEEIQEQADQIRHINENLEELVAERTRELERKNKALEEYAFINAHQLRSPVASILGLVDIIEREESVEEQKVIISHLRETTIKLDVIVGSITKAIEGKV